MPRIKLQSEDTDNKAINDIFTEIKNASGDTIPAPYRAFGRLEHVLQANWHRTKRVLREGNLPIQLKESIALAVSSANGCEFCISIHRSNLTKQGFNQEVINQVENASSPDEKVDMTLKFAVQASRDPHALIDADFEELKNFGYSEEDILEILTVMEMYTGYNKIITALGIKPGD
jgi:uncharacterized peroxidase-related enzyme